MYISDFRTIGARFILTGVQSTRRTLFGKLIIYCNGRLEYGNEVFHVIVSQRDDDMLKIKYTCSNDKEDAYRQFARLRQIMRESLARNTNSIKYLYFARLMRKMVFNLVQFLSISGIISSMVSLILCHSLSSVVCAIVFFIILWLSYRNKYRFLFAVEQQS